MEFINLCDLGLLGLNLQTTDRKALRSSTTPISKVAFEMVCSQQSIICYGVRQGSIFQSSHSLQYVSGVACQNAQNVRLETFSYVLSGAKPLVSRAPAMCFAAAIWS